MANDCRPNLSGLRASLWKRQPFNWPIVSVTAVWFLLPILTVTALCLGFAAGWVNDRMYSGILIGVGGVIVALVMVLGIFLVHSNAKVLAPLFMARYGVNERARAESMIMEMLQTSKTSKFRVMSGVLETLVEDDDNAGTDKKSKPNVKNELFRATGRGAASIAIDLESAVLVRRGEHFQVFHGPKCDLGKDDEYINSVLLRPQKESIEVKGALTRDTVALDITGSVVYQIQQSKEYLEQYRRYQGDWTAIQRALLPHDEWMQRTRASIASAVRGVVREYELWQMFAAPPKPPTPTEMATIYTLGQSIVPNSTRVYLEELIKARLNDSCWRWGVEVTRVVIDEVSPPQEIRDAAHHAYLSWTQMSEHILEAEKEAQSKLRTAKVEYEEKSIRAKAELLDADNAKQKVILEAEAEADAYRKRMHARAEGALEFARHMEIIEQGLGDRIDEGAMRELLRALGFMQHEKTEEDPKWLLDYMARRGYSSREE